jgi:hypothetical protein
VSAAAGRVEVRLALERPLGAAAVVALEDYARELTQAKAASALFADPAGERLLGLALEAPALAPEGAVLEDIQAFAQDLAEQVGLGLGWT